MTFDEITDRLKDLIVSIADYDLHKNMIGEDDNGIRRLGLNSLSLLRLLASIEKEFNVTTEPDETDADVLSSIKNIARYIQQKMGE